MKTTKTRERNNLKKDSYENLLDGIKIWTEYWRKNPHRFCEDWLGIHLYPFQMLLLYMMNTSNSFVFTASRGLGKSFLTAVFCCVRCILYPGTKIVIASGNKKQAANIITEKVEELRTKYPRLQAEIDKITTNHESVKCIFKNTSVISIVASNDGARSGRGNILIADEYRMIRENIINTVLKQFLTAPRRPGYMELPEYEDYPLEANKEIYLSSAYLRSHWSFNKFMTITKRMAEKGNAFSCCIPYICGLDNKIITKQRIEEDREEIGEFSFLMEYCSYWYGENENSFFKSDEINKCRVLRNAYYPLTDDEYRNPEIKKKRLKQMPKKKDEIRLIGCDIAVCSSSSKAHNDNSVFTLMRLLPNGDGYIREVVHIESYDGSLSVEEQSTRIKRLFEEFEADKLIIDAQGIGYSVLSELTKSSNDKSIDEHYEPYVPYDSSTSLDVEFNTEGKEVIYVFKGYEQTNNNVNVFLKNAFMSKKIRLLIDENEKKDDFSNDKNFATDGIYKAEKLIPFIQTSQFVFETLNLEYEVRPSGNIAIKEKGKNRKDRYSSLAYVNYLAQLIDNEEYKRRNKKSGGFMFFD